MLYVEKLPKHSEGANVAFANMHVAYDLLAEPVKSSLDNLTAVHVPDASSTREETNLSAEHPVVIRHPLTGRRAIFVNRLHTRQVAQLDSAQSLSTLDLLCQQIERFSALTCRIRLTESCVVIWDNHSAQHLELQDFWSRGFAAHLIKLVGCAPER